MILDEDLKKVLFTNREAARKLKGRNGSDFKYIFDASTSNRSDEKSINMDEPAFGLVENLGLQAFDYVG